MRLTLLLISVCTLLLAGCSTVKVNSLGQKADISKYRHIYVQSASNDNAAIDVLIADELKRLGYDAAAGVKTMAPLNTELLITYETRWEWDFRQYLMDLVITVRDAHSEMPLVQGSIDHPGVTKRTNEQLVQQVLAPLFKPVK